MAESRFERFGAEHAALTEPLAVGIKRLPGEYKSGEVQMVIGCGPVGLAVIARIQDQGECIRSGRRYRQRGGGLAAKLGGRHRLDPAQSRPTREWQRCRR